MKEAFVKKSLWLEMSSQFCQACPQNGVGEDEEKGKTIYCYLHGPLCLGMQTETRSSPAVELQRLMYVETFTCRCGNLE